VPLKSPYSYCEACRQGCRALDAQLGLPESQQISPAREEQVVLLGCHHEYQQADGLLRRL
jgi:hypothetical protein